MFLKKDYIWTVRSTYYWWKVHIWTTWSKPKSQNQIPILERFSGQLRYNHIGYWLSGLEPKMPMSSFASWFVSAALIFSSHVCTPVSLQANCNKQTCADCACTIRLHRVDGRWPCCKECRDEVLRQHHQPDDPRPLRRRYDDEDPDDNPEVGPIVSSHVFAFVFPVRGPRKIDR